MEFKNTIQSLQKLGTSVVKEGKGILRKKKKSSGTLYNDFDYLVTNTGDTVTLEFEFGNADNYWKFIDEGVRGAGGYEGSAKPKKRGKGSPFKFSSKMPPLKPLLDWIKSKGIKGRVDKKWKSAGNRGGQFITNKSFAFLIQRSIFQRGLPRTLFFSKPFTEQFKKQTDSITEAFADDLKIALDQT
tara:strand:+ start:555 stop:1112 length:558 start_codon:yes stop_codon:yes gene_type:complete